MRGLYTGKKTSLPHVFEKGVAAVMKKYILWTSILLCLMLTACGAKEGAGREAETGGESGMSSASQESTWQGLAPGDDLQALAERTEYYDLTAETEELFDLGLWDESALKETVQERVRDGSIVYLPLETQFWKGEPVQLWLEVSSKGRNVYLYRKDGSGELLLENVSDEHSAYSSYEGRHRWYLDEEGNLFCYYNKYSVANGGEQFQGEILKILSSGEILYKTELELGFWIEDFCQTGDGRIWLLLQEDGEELLRLAELDSATGQLIPGSRREIPFERQRMVSLGAAGELPAALGYFAEERNYRVMKADFASGEMIPVLYLAGTSYILPASLWLQNFQVLEDGVVELLLTDSNGKNCRLDKIKMQKTEKIPIVVRGGYWVDGTFREQVSQFNMKNSTYQVIVEDCTDPEALEDFARLTSVQMNAGKGPDILYGDDLMEDYIAGILEKGALEDLKPYMKADGVREEDYFPLTFSAWRQGERIYGINYRVHVYQATVKEEVLGSRETPDMETLVDALLAREGDCLYMGGRGPGQVLEDWLEGTESLFGMVDWEQGSCDFHTPLFHKLLEAAARYGDNGRKNGELAVASGNGYDNVLHFSGSAELEAQGRVVSGIQFDDGCYACFTLKDILAVNANSTHKEGAWEFIRFLLSDEIQGAKNDSYAAHIVSVSYHAFEEWLPWCIAEMTQIKYVNGVPHLPVFEEEVSKERQAEYRQMIEEARPLPIRTKFILEVILDEAQDYFDGYKSTDEVIQVINNRVQLYLDENQ